MVENHIRRQGITNSAINTAFSQVPRHRFVLPDWVDFSYEDRPLPIGYNQTI